jgi:selenocysteine lyase/cysteine desulfurase
VQYSPYTGVCLLDLSRLLTLYASRKIKIGSFSAASNVTGVLTATNDVSTLMHRANGWAFFDYASAAPYIDVRTHYY